MKDWIDRTPIERTLKNVRWWIIFPITLPYLIYATLTHCVTSTMIEVGRWTMNKGYKLHRREVNKPMKWLLDWMKNDG